MKATFLALKDLLVAALFLLFSILTRHMQRAGLILAFNFPEGSRFQFSPTFAATKAITTISNADPAAVGSVAHGYSDGNEVLVRSGWEDADYTVFEVNQTSADALELLGLNSVNTNFYPAGTGTGTMSLISAWQTMPDVLTINTAGGDPRFTDVQLLARRNAIKVPTGFNAQTITLTLAHDPANAIWLIMLGLSKSLTPVAFKQILSGGAVTYGYGYMAASPMPSLNVNQANAVTVSIALLGQSMSYPS
jgi:Phage tail tube protein, TTP